MNLNCVQCQEKLILSDDLGDNYYRFRLPLCQNPKCPNYGLYQTGTLEKED